MKYKGRELTEFKSNKNIAFNPKQHMIVWGDGKEWYYADIVGYFPDNAHPFLADNNLRYKHGAEIPKPQTNWDTFQQRYGTEKIDVKDAITKFIYSHMRCDFCPAKQQCSNLHTGDLKACVDTFKAWAEMEADEEK